MVSAFTIVNKVISCLLNVGAIKLRKPSVQTLEYHGSEVILCYTPVPSEAKVSLTENINIHACGGEFDGIESVLSFTVLNLAND